MKVVACSEGRGWSMEREAAWALPLMKKELSRGSWDLRFFKVFSSCALSGEPLM